MQQRAIGILALAALIALAACGGGGVPSSSEPTNVRAQAGDGYVTVTWDFGGDASSFGIYRETIGAASLGTQTLEPIDTVEDGSARIYEDIAVDSTETYAYGVSVNGGEPVRAGGTGVSPDPGARLDIVFDSPIPPGETVSITSDPSRIDCAGPGAGCQDSFAVDRIATLYAETSEGIKAVWEGCDTTSVEVCDVMMSSDRTVYVSFVSTTLLSVGVTPGGAGVVTNVNDLGEGLNIECPDVCVYEFPENWDVTLRAEPKDASKWERTAWTGDCPDPGSNTCRIVMSESRDVTAQFRLVPPVIQVFEPELEGGGRIEIGQSTFLTWDVTGGGDIESGEFTVSIDPEIGFVDSKSGSDEVSPIVTTDYTLTATNASETVKKSVTVVVGQGPRVDGFTAVPKEATPGSDVELTWDVSGEFEGVPLTLTLVLPDESEVDVSDQASYVANPTEDSTYTLIAENSFGKDEQSEQVFVGEAPRITFFNADDETVTSGSEVRLAWGIAGREPISLTLDPVGDVTGDSEAFLRPTETATYTLFATSPYGTAEPQQVEITVGVGPTIETFEASDETITIDQSTRLSWSATGDAPLTLSIAPTVGNVPNNSFVDVSPNSETSYRLTVSNDFDEITSAPVTISVGEGPAISSFTATPETVIAGEDVVLAWEASNYSALVIDNDVGPVTGTSTTVTPPSTTTPSTTTYRLTASNEFDSASKTVGVTVEQRRVLSVGVDPAGVGRVVSTNDLGTYEDVSCEDTCSYEYPNGLSVGLEAQLIDAANYELDGWGGACSGSTGATCTVAMSTDRSVEAGFRLIPPAIDTFRAEPSSSGSEDSWTLSWDVIGGGDLTDGTLSISVEPDVGPLDVRSGSVEVSPLETTEYTITATNASGTASDVETVTVESEPVTSLSPSSSTCDRTPTGSDCEVTVSLLNADGAYEGAQFEFGSSAFDLLGAATGAETTGCLIDAGATTVIVACDGTFGSGSVASLMVSRTLASASTFEVSSAELVVEGALGPVQGGTLAVAAAD